MRDTPGLTARRIAEAVQSGRLSATTVAEDALRRAGDLTSCNIFISLDRTAVLAMAERVDGDPALRAQPLAGVPFAVKDNIDVAGQITTCGIGAFVHRPPAPAHAVIVERLVGLGAIPIGKTNMAPFAFGNSADNPAFGRVRLPGRPARELGGSSAGSAAAVATGIVPLALGTDTGGSIRVPAARCGVAGFRASLGAWPMAGIQALSPSRDTVGLIAADIEDMAFVHDALFPRGAERLSSTSAAGPRLRFGAAFTEPAGIARDALANVSARPGSAIEIVPTGLLALTRDVLDAGRLVVEAEAAQAVHAHSCDDATIDSWFPSGVAQRIRRGVDALGDGTYEQARIMLQEARAAFVQEMNRAGFDAFLYPMFPPSAETADNAAAFFAHVAPGSVIGLPGLVWRSDSGVDLALDAAPHTDDRLFDLATTVAGRLPA